MTIPTILKTRNSEFSKNLCVLVPSAIANSFKSKTIQQRNSKYYICCNYFLIVCSWNFFCSYHLSQHVLKMYCCITKKERSFGHNEKRTTQKGEEENYRDDSSSTWC